MNPFIANILYGDEPHEVRGETIFKQEDLARGLFVVLNCRLLLSKFVTIINAKIVEDTDED